MPIESLLLHPEERALRRHIQRQTLEYAQKYITTDHIWYTETGVAEIFSTSLNEISLSDPTDVSFPVDPLEKLLGTSKPKPYDEQFILSAEERDGARKIISGYLGACRNKRVESRCMEAMKSEDPNILELPRRPLSPILTARARQQTPKMLHRSKAQIIGMLPTEMSESVDRARIHSVAVEDIVQERIQQEPFLNIQYTMSKEEATEFRNFVTQVSAGKTKRPPSGFVDFLRAESPPPPPAFPRPITPRLFPRSESKSMGVDRAELVLGDNLAEAVGKAGVERVEVEEGFGLDEIAQENMRVLSGGFDVLPPSSPPPLSFNNPTDFASSDAAQPSSPPRTPRIHPSGRALMVSSSPSVQNIKLAKFDEILFPSDQMRGRRMLPKKDPPKFFDTIADLHRPVPTRPEADALPPVATILVPASPSISNDSIAGQPDEEEEEIDELADDNSTLPSRRTSRAVSRRTSRKTVDSQVDELADDDTLVDAVVDKLTRGLGVDPFEYVMKEKLDEKDVLMLDVPELPPPNVSRIEGAHPAPTSLGEFIDLSKDGKEAKDGFGIRRVGGIKSLQIELGWRVTIPGEPVTLEQAVNAQNPTDPEAKSLVKEFRARLNQGQENPSEVEQPEEDVGSVGKGDAWARDGMIMTREEREKVYGWRPPGQEQRLDPPREDVELPSQSDELGNPHPTPPTIESTTQASFVPLSFGTQGPQVKWNEQLHSVPASDSYCSIEEEQTVAYKQSWVDDSGYYDQEMEMEEPQGDEDQYWFQMLSQEAEYAQRANPTPMEGDADRVELMEGQTYEVGDDFAVSMDVEPRIQATRGPDTPTISAEVYPENVIDVEAEPVDDGATEQYPAEVSPSIELGILLAQKPGLAPRVQPDYSAPNKLAEFMYARAKASILSVDPPITSIPSPLASPPPEAPVAERPAPGESPLYPIPQEVRSLLTLSPDDSSTEEPEPFRILATMDLIQHRALVVALQHPSVGLQLVERSSAYPNPSTDTGPSWSWRDTTTPLHGASLALDPNTALVLIPLAELASPDAVPALSRLLQSLLTRFEWIGLVLEAYPRPKPQSRTSTLGIDQTDENFTLDPFTPPALKSLSALRRALALLHNAFGLVPVAGTGGVEVGIGRNAQETAGIVRCAVNRAVESWRAREGRAGEVWGGREWVQDDECTEEQELANVPRMNIFAAITVLAQTTVDELLSMTAEERTRIFGPSITESKVVALNEVIAQGQARVEMIGQAQELGASEEGVGA